ncbi:hypothetical protein L249_1023, partial [Ophiocordyceps polyrhachis-furcata BCC 54312]
PLTIYIKDDYKDSTNILFCKSIRALEPLNYKLADLFPPTRTVASLIERTRSAIPQEEASNIVDCNKEVFNYKEAAFNKVFNYEDAIYISPPRQTSSKLSDPGAKTPSPREYDFYELRGQQSKT